MKLTWTHNHLTFQRWKTESGYIAINKMDHVQNISAGPRCYTKAIKNLDLIQSGACVEKLPVIHSCRDRATASSELNREPEVKDTS